MSEEESFVILGSSPTPSMEAYASINKDAGRNSTPQKSVNMDSGKSSINPAIPQDLVASTNSDGNFSILNHPANAETGDAPSSITSRAIPGTSKQNAIEANMASSNFSILEQSKYQTDGDISSGKADKSIDSAISSSSAGSAYSKPQFMSGGASYYKAKDSSQSKGDAAFVSADHNSLTESTQGSLAASFLLGEVPMDVLKANVFSQFPSLCGSQAKADDIIKLQNFISEYLELKDNLQKTNTAMKQHFSIIQKWQGEMKVYKESQDKQMKECYELVAKLSNENMELKKELDLKIEQIQMSDKLMREENDSLRQLISEKVSVIQNMSSQIERLEQNQYVNKTSFEIVRKPGEPEPETSQISLEEHKSKLKELERKLSELTAENLELQDMKNIYVDEINCLKVNLTGAEELLKKAQADINILKSKDIEKSELFDKYELEKNEMKQEINILRAQLEVYSKDFAMERAARQNLAGEKDQLLNDLKMLQKRNQELIEEAQSRLERDLKREKTPSSSFKQPSFRKTSSKQDNPGPSQQPKEDQVYERANFVCPLCEATFKDLDTLQNHVQDCLDKAPPCDVHICKD